MKLKMFLTSLFLALALSACATTGGVTSPTTSATPAAAPFIAWSTACNSFSAAEYAALIAIEGNKIPQTAFPIILQVQSTITPLCTTYPTDPTAATSQIESAITSLGLQTLTNQANANGSAKP